MYMYYYSFVVWVLQCSLTHIYFPYLYTVLVRIYDKIVKRKKYYQLSIYCVCVCGCWPIFEYCRCLLSLYIYRIFWNITQSLLHEHFCPPETTVNKMIHIRQQYTELEREQSLSPEHRIYSIYIILYPVLLSISSSYHNILFLLWLYSNNKATQSFLRRIESATNSFNNNISGWFGFHFLIQYYYCTTVVECMQK